MLSNPTEPLTPSSDIHFKIHLEDEKLEQETSSISSTPILKKNNKIFNYDDRQIYLLSKRFKRLHLDAGKLLEQSQRNARVSITIKILIIILGLSTSYISAISDFESTAKTYITTIFSLGSALLSGLTSVKNFSKESEKLYSGYKEYIEKATSIEPLFYDFKGKDEYQDIISSIDKLISKYEGFIKKSEEEHQVHSTRRSMVIENLLIEKFKENNDGKIPDWLSSQFELRKEIKESQEDKKSFWKRIFF